MENTKNQIKNKKLRVNITPKNIQPNFLPINAVSGSSLTLMNFKYFTVTVFQYLSNFNLIIEIIKYRTLLF